MADLGELKAKISAQIDEFEKGFDDAGKKVDEFGQKTDEAGKKSDKSMKSFSETMKGLKEPLMNAVKTATAFAAALTIATIKSIDMLGAQIDLARALGVTNKELAIMKRAADLSGISASEMETNMRMLNKRLGDIIANGGKSADTLLKMGISFNELMSARPEEQMYLLAEGMKNLTTHEERAYVATELFGRSGMNMLNLLSDAQVNFGRARKEVEKFGTALNKIDTVNIENAGDNISTVKYALQGLATQITAQVAPAVNKIAEALGNAIGNYAELIKKAREYKQITSGTYEELLTDEQIIEIGKKYGELLTERKVQQEQVDKWGAEGSKMRIEDINAEIDALTNAIKKNEERKLSLKEEETNKPVDSPAKAVEETENKDAILEAEAEAEFQRAKLEQLQQSLMAEDELLKYNLQASRDIVQEAYEAGEIDLEEHNALMLAIDADYLDKLEKNRKSTMTAIQKFQAMSWHQQSAQVAGELAGLTQTLDSTNKDQFKIVKAGAIAQAIVNTYQGISKSLASYPWPLAGIMAAAHAAAGFMQVDNIRKQEFNSSSYSAPTAPTSVPAEVAQANSSGAMVTINLTGQTYQKQDVADLITQINEAVGDGAKIRVG